MPVKTFYRADAVVVSYHFLNVMRADAMANNPPSQLLDLIDAAGDEFSRGVGAMIGVGMTVTVRADYGPIEVELRFGAVPEDSPESAGPEKCWSGVISFDHTDIDIAGFDGPVFDNDYVIPLPAGPGIYRAHVRWSYRPRPLPPDDYDVPYESWSDVDKNNPASEDFWETITITLQSDPDAMVTAAPFRPAPTDEAYLDTSDLPPIDYYNWTDRTGTLRPMAGVEMGSEEWLEQASSFSSDQPSITGEGKKMWLVTGVQWERPMLLPHNPRQIADYVAPSMFAEVGTNGRIVYGRRSTLPPDDPRYQPRT
jgi:hypothetical protein